MTTPNHDPTPAEIKAACEAIRAGWSEAETRRRSAWCECERWTAPEVAEVVDDYEFFDN